MDLHYKQEISVGLLVITALAVFGAGLAWLSGKSWGGSSGVRVGVRFTDVNGLRPGDPVQISGVKVGRVENVVLQDVGQVMVYLSVNPDSRPHVDARASVAPLDFFGARFIDFYPGRDAQLLKADGVITGSREVAFTEGAAGLTAQATEVLTGAQGILTERTAMDIHATMVAATKALDVISRVGNGPGVNEATGALRSVQALSAHIDSIVSNPSVKRSVDQLGELTSNLNKMTVDLSVTTKALGSIVEKMDSGKGSFGRALADTSLYMQMHRTLKSMQELLDDVKAHPERYIKVKVF